ncbi:MAG: Lrp/AsnC ligand binding domain-containing protein [Chloroflexi bacterium]|nr:Lrp/AsnC ligand binding domain-containing protein [Chloroflexota bacterium]
MAVVAFVLVTTRIGETKEVLKGLKKIDGVKSVDVVLGPYDIIAVVEGDSLESIGKLITGVEGLERTTTCQAIRVA